MSTEDTAMMQLLLILQTTRIIAEAELMFISAKGLIVLEIAYAARHLIAQIPNVLVTLTENVKHSILKHVQQEDIVVKQTQDIMLMTIMLLGVLAAKVLVIFAEPLQALLEHAKLAFAAEMENA